MSELQPQRPPPSLPVEAWHQHHFHVPRSRRWLASCVNRSRQSPLPLPLLLRTQVRDCCWCSDAAADGVVVLMKTLQCCAGNQVNLSTAIYTPSNPTRPVFVGSSAIEISKIKDIALVRPVQAFGKIADWDAFEAIVQQYVCAHSHGA
jgi:hypothetical protein